MTYTVVYSKDPYLLARLATDLQMSGVKSDIGWDINFNPFSESLKPCRYVAIGDGGVSKFSFHNHECFEPTIRHELTSRNYLSVLTKILEA